MHKSFVCIQFQCKTVLFDPFWVRMYSGVMAMKGYSTFPKAPASVKGSVCFVSYPVHSFGESYPPTDMQLVYSVT